MKVKIYVEGGGDSKATQAPLRQGFEKLLEKAGFKNRMPSVVGCGGRDQAFHKFQNALKFPEQNTIYLLLVDSEDPVTALTPWQHLKTRDNWNQPNDTTNEQVHFMATCMETWLIADRENLRRYFGQKFNENALPASTDLEMRSRKVLFASLEQATKDCQKKQYKKGGISFELLETTNPKLLMNLSYFQRFVNELEKHLNP